jgi:hypothetical protein
MKRPYSMIGSLDITFFFQRAEYTLIMKSIYPLEASYLTKSLIRIFDTINQCYIPENPIELYESDVKASEIVNSFTK